MPKKKQLALPAPDAESSSSSSDQQAGSTVEARDELALVPAEKTVEERERTAEERRQEELDHQRTTIIQAAQLFDQQLRTLGRDHSINFSQEFAPKMVERSIQKEILSFVHRELETGGSALWRAVCSGKNCGRRRRPGRMLLVLMLMLSNRNLGKKPSWRSLLSTLGLDIEATSRGKSSVKGLLSPIKESPQKGMPPQRHTLFRHLADEVWQVRR